MNMFVTNLAKFSFDTLLACFLTAFEGYFVTMPTDSEYYKERWAAAMVDFKYSYGMFDGERLVGFVLHGIDVRNEIPTAYNAGTGVIPEYRGKKVVKSIYDHAFNDLAKRGIEKVILEVITKNTIAIAAYKSIGFKTRRSYKCFKGNITIDPTIVPEFEELDMKTIPWQNLPNQHLYSWDNQTESLLAGNYRFFQVLHGQQAESFFIINPKQHYLAQFDVFIKNDGTWERLFAAIAKISKSIKVNNISTTLHEKWQQLFAVGLENTIDQYEMEIPLTTDLT